MRRTEGWSGRDPNRPAFATPVVHVEPEALRSMQWAALGPTEALSPAEAPNAALRTPLVKGSVVTDRADDASNSPDRYASPARAKGTMALSATITGLSQTGRPENATPSSVARHISGPSS